MTQKLYNEENIRGIANAIRRKNGTDNTYTVAQMEAAVDAIETGGGGGYNVESVPNGDGTQTLVITDGGESKQEIIDSLLNGSITGTIYSETNNVIGYSLYKRSKIEQVILPNATTIGGVDGHTFQYCYILKKVYAPNAIEIPTYCFNCDYALEEVVITNAQSIGSYAFVSCGKIAQLDVPNVLTIGTRAMQGMSGMTDLWLRTTTRVCTYSSSGSQYDPPNENLKIHVPAALIEQYKVATNWVRLADKFVPIEEETT